ncbi:MAG: CPBP family intramembrane metalloprotease [Oscillospiraceae bacterium]|nr:CPBP family intramembrane metalloprotease [Oscillospiraceae bacterium]
MRERKIREHRFLNKHTIPGVLLLMLGAHLIVEILLSNLAGIPFAIIFRENVSAVTALSEAINIFAAFLVLSLYWRHFYPEFEGNLKGGSQVGKWTLFGVAAALVFTLWDVIQNHGSSRIGFPGSVNILAGLMAGVCEETIYRGVGTSYLMRQWREEKKILPAMIITSTVFGLIHLVNLSGGSPLVIVIPQVINAGVIGMLLCAVYLRSGNLIPVMVLHTLNDFGKLMFIDVLQEGGGYSADITISPAEFIPLIVSLVVYLAAALYLVRSSKRKEIIALWDKKWNQADPTSGK